MIDTKKRLRDGFIRPERAQWDAVIMDAAMHMVHGGTLPSFSAMTRIHPDWLWNRFSKVPWYRDMTRRRWKGHAPMSDDEATALLSEILSPLGLRGNDAPSCASIGPHYRDTKQSMQAPKSRQGGRAERAATLMPLIHAGMTLGQAAKEVGLGYDAAWRSVRHLSLPDHAKPRNRREGGTSQVGETSHGSSFMPLIQIGMALPGPVTFHHIGNVVAPSHGVQPCIASSPNQAALHVRGNAPKSIPTETFSLLDAYVADIGRGGRDSLKGVDEAALFRAWREGGDEDARNRIIEGCLRFVVKTATRWARAYCIDKADLIQEGNLGLFEAMRGFDASKNVKFLTYAGHHINAAMQDAVQNKTRMIRVPEKVVDVIRKVRRGVAECERHGGDPMDHEAVAAYSGLSVAEVAKGIYADRVSQIVDVTGRCGDDDGCQEFDQVASRVPGDTCAHQKHCGMDDAKIVHGLLDLVQEEERHVLVMRYHIGQEGGDNEVTYSEIAHALGKSREWARKTHNLAVDKLKVALDCQRKEPRSVKTVIDLMASTNECDADAVEAFAMKCGIAGTSSMQARPHSIKEIGEWFGVDHEGARDMWRHGFGLVFGRTRLP